MTVRVTRWVQTFENPIFNESVRLIVTLSLLVLHNATLIIEFLLSNNTQEMTHPV
jgi:hypothetical protein